MRPRPQETERYHCAQSTLEALSPSDRGYIGIKPADIPAK
jgi:hypothetical protein